MSIVGSPPSSGEELLPVRFVGPWPGVGRWAKAAPPESKKARKKAEMSRKKCLAIRWDMANSTPIAGDPSTAVSYTSVLQEHHARTIRGEPALAHLPSM